MYLKFHSKGNYGNSVNPTSSDSTFSGGGDDEGKLSQQNTKQTHQSQMPLYSHLEGTGSFVGKQKGGRARHGQQDPLGSYLSSSDRIPAM
ncbi:hypothetical protein Tco_0484615 [Tanacetum coccineum]